MKKTITRLVVMLIAAILLCGLAACDRDEMNPKSVEFKEVHFNGTFTGSSSERPSSAIVRNQEELVALFSGYSIEWEDDVSITTQYDSEYFENNALVFHFFGVSGDYSPDFSVEDVQVDKEALKLSVVQKGLTTGDAYDFTVEYPKIPELSTIGGVF